MMVTAQELFLDLTKEDHNSRDGLRQARTAALADDVVRELTLVSDLDTPFAVRELGQILQQAKTLQSLSLFSMALTGSHRDFVYFTDVLRSHRALQEVHLVDCGMIAEGGGGPPTTAVRLPTSRATAAGGGGGTTTTTGATATHNNNNTTVLQVPPSVTPLLLVPPARPMDAILQALSQIPTLESVEIYSIPVVGDDEEDDEDGDSEAVPIAEVAITGNVISDQENGIASMETDSFTEEDDDDDGDDDDFFMDDEDERDFRGIPPSRRGRCTNQNLDTFLMAPLSMASLCGNALSLQSISLEDMALQDEHIVQMSRALTTNRVLKNLKLWGCSINDRGCFSIAQMLEVNKTLERLDLSNNRIQDDGCVALAVALRYNVALRYLCLVGNDCTATSNETNSNGRCYESLLELLQMNNVLEDLILEPNEMEDGSRLPTIVVIPALE